MTRRDAAAIGRLARAAKFRNNAAERFWARVAMTDNAADCWDWKGKIANGDKYPRLSCRAAFPCISPAHRVAYKLHYGFIPEGFQICHICNNKMCCNPSHLYAGTSMDNYLDMVAAGTAIGLPERVLAHAGHNSCRSKLTPEQVAEIRREYRAWPHGKRTEICQSRYGITRETARRVYAGETYHLES